MATRIEEIVKKAITPGIMKIADFNRKRMRAPEGGHVYLSGINAPVADEVTETDLQVTGEIPAELNGRYFRIGPNPITQPDLASHHWFAGDGMVHGVRLKDGKPEWYRNRYVRSTHVSETLGEEPKPGTRSEFSDTTNTNIIGHAGSIWGIVEAGGFPVRMDKNLETIAHDPFDGTLQHAFSAHPHIDVDTGEMHAICYKAVDANVVYHTVLDTNGKIRREEPIRVQDGPMIHDCMVTKNYIIILDLPITFSMKAVLAGHLFPYRWNPAHKARVGLLPKGGTDADVIWCPVEPCAVFHPANAYENDDGSITFDACVHDKMFTRSTQGPDSEATPLERWHIDPKAKTVARKTIDPDPQEFPRINEGYTGRPYRYAYTMALPKGFENLANHCNQLYKQDLESGTREVHDFGKGKVPNEFVFVSRQGASAEDDGWLMGYLSHEDSDDASFVILNTNDFAGPPAATIHIPHRIPSGFHGNWIAD